MKKFILLFSMVVLSACLKSQSFYYEMESSIDGITGLMAKMYKTKMTVYVKGNKVKTVIESMGNTETIIADEERVVITTTSPKRCVIITKEDLLKDSLDAPENIVVIGIEKTTEVQNINGYNCQKTIVNYQLVGMKDMVVATYWNTNDIKFYKPTKKPLQYRKIKPVNVATEDLGGFTMLSVIKINSEIAGEMTTNMEVSKTSTSEIKDSEFEPDAKLCKNPMNLEEYKKALKKDSEMQNKMNQQMNFQSNHFVPMHY